MQTRSGLVADDAEHDPVPALDNASHCPDENVMRLLRPEPRDDPDDKRIPLDAELRAGGVARDRRIELNTVRNDHDLPAVDPEIGQ